MTAAPSPRHIPVSDAETMNAGRHRYNELDRDRLPPRTLPGYSHPRFLAPYTYADRASHGENAALQGAPPVGWRVMRAGMHRDNADRNALPAPVPGGEPRRTTAPKMMIMASKTPVPAGRACLQPADRQSPYVAARLCPEYRSDVPLLPAFRFPAPQNGANITPFAFIMIHGLAECRLNPLRRVLVGRVFELFRDQRSEQSDILFI